MAASINKTHPVQLGLTVTPDQNAALKEIAERDGISVRALLRQLVTDLVESSQVVFRLTPDLLISLSRVAEVRGTSEQNLMAQYTTAGVTHDMLRLGLITVKEN